MRKLLPFIPVILVIGCSAPSNQPAEISRDSVIVSDTIPTTTAPVIIPKLPNDSLVLISDTSEIIVGVLVKEYYEKTPHTKSLAQCRSWNLDSSQVVTILRNAAPTDGMTIHDVYNTYPCDLKGSVAIDGKKYKISINGGSHFVLIHSDTAYLFRCTGELEKLFIEGVVSMEE